MLRVYRWLKIRQWQRSAAALALALGLSGAQLIAADMSTPARPYSMARPLAPSQFSGTQSYGQAAYAPHTATSRQPHPGSMLRFSQPQYNQHKYLPQPQMPTLPERQQLSRTATASDPLPASSPYSFAGTPLATTPAAPQLSKLSPNASGAVSQAAFQATPAPRLPVAPATPPQLSRLNAATGPSATQQLQRAAPWPQSKPLATATSSATIEKPQTHTATAAAPNGPVGNFSPLAYPAVYQAYPMPAPAGYAPASYFASPYAQFGAMPPAPPRRQGSSLNSLVSFDNNLVQMDQLDPAPGDDDEPSTAQDNSRDDGAGPPRRITGDTPADQVFGVAPQADTLQFLRAQSVLLEPGERQIDIGFEYAISEGRPLVPFDAIPTVPPSSDEANIRQRNRLAAFPLEIRYGLKENVQLFAGVPFGWSNAELAAPGFDEYSNKVGIGDVNFGSTILLCDGGGNAADVVATLAVTAPTGDSEFPIFPTTPFSQLGEGFWAGLASVIFIKTYDPIVVFYGVGYRHRFDAEFDTLFGPQDVNPGEQFLYQFGVGFAANETVTLSCNYVGMYITENYINGFRVQGGILEPMQLRFAITCAQECKIVEPFAVIGMTEDAPSARVGITWTF